MIDKKIEVSMGIRIIFLKFKSLGDILSVPKLSFIFSTDSIFPLEKQA